MKKDTEAIILAGGKGSRMGRLTATTQKCLLPIDGKPIIGHVIDALSEVFDHIDLKVGVSYKSEEVKKFIESYKGANITVTYVPHTSGTEGYGIYEGMNDHIHGPFVAMPGDIIVNPELLRQVTERFAKGDCDAALALATDVNEVDTHGVGKIKNGLVTGLQWPPPDKLNATDLRDMTIWASDRRIFDILKKYPCHGKSIGHVFMQAVKNGKRIAGVLYDLPWIHIGYPEDLNKSVRKLRDRRSTAMPYAEGEFSLPFAL